MSILPSRYVRAHHVDKVLPLPAGEDASQQCRGCSSPIFPSRADSHPWVPAVNRQGHFSCSAWVLGSKLLSLEPRVAETVRLDLSEKGSAATSIPCLWQSDVGPTNFATSISFPGKILAGHFSVYTGQSHLPCLSNAA